MTKDLSYFIDGKHFFASALFVFCLGRPGRAVPDAFPHHWLVNALVTLERLLDEATVVKQDSQKKTEGQKEQEREE